MYQPITGTGTGVSPVINLPWPFLSKDHISATVNGAPALLAWTGASQVTFAAAVANGAAWQVFRATPTDAPLVDFTDGAILTEHDLETAQAQALYRLQELVQPTVNGAPLAASSGAGLIGWAASGVSAVVRSVRDKLRDQVSLADFGAVGDGTTDDTAAVQAAVTAAAAAGKKLFIPAPASAYKLTAPITISASLRMEGEGVAPYDSTLGARGKGAWFYLAHLGKGFVVSNMPHLMGGTVLRGFATYRNQPAPGPGWAPLAADYDIDISNADVLIEDVLLLNPTKGVRLTSGNAGRLTVHRLRGQPFDVGINIDDSYDGFIADNVRWWTFWSNDANVNAYTKANRKGLILAHADNPSLKGFFDIYSRYAVFFTSSANGVTSRANFLAPEFDGIGEAAIFVDGTAHGTTAQVVGGYVFGDSAGASTQIGVSVNANNTELSMTGFRWSNLKTRAALVLGTGNVLIVNGPHVNSWNTINGSNEAFAANTGNKIILTGAGYYSGGNGAPKINNAALVSSKEWLTTAPTVTATSGTLTAAAADFRFNRDGNTVTFQATLTVTTNGTGATALSVPLPVPVATGANASAAGRLTNGSGKMVNAALSASTMLIRTYDNLYPAVDGSVIVINGTYQTDPL